MPSVTLARVRDVLGRLGIENEHCARAVIALLDEGPSQYGAVLRALPKTRFRDGASIRHIADHIGKKQLKRQRGLDREGRDYWVAPLVSLGAVERVHWLKQDGGYARVDGHPVPKSSNNCYRISDDFERVLRTEPAAMERQLDRWIAGSKHRERAAVGAQAASVAGEGSHAALIRSAVEVFAPHGLPGYEVIFVDDSDGTRVAPVWRGAMDRAGISLELGDRWPDVILWNRRDDVFWLIDAVTSDGELDEQRVADICESLARHGKKAAGFTTVYPDWRTAAARQHRVKNLAVGTSVWIAEDGGKLLAVHSAVSDR